MSETIFGGMVLIPGGDFIMGSNEFYPDERPARGAAVDGFLIDKFAVTNAEFERFVNATGYVTTAEIAPKAEDYPDADPAMLRPGSAVFEPTGHVAPLSKGRTWWRYAFGACWRHPEGAGSDIAGRLNHPVVHVSFEDAQTYAAWCGKSLPTEAEWEFAARGGLLGARYAWGQTLSPGGVKMANYWTGIFPHHRVPTDGSFMTTAVGSYPPNRYGLYDMIGNVWEWTCDDYTLAPRAGSACCRMDQDVPSTEVKVIKGGSFLCAENYCCRYRPAARHPQDVRTTTSHIGFRCVVRDIPLDLRRNNLG